MLTACLSFSLLLSRVSAFVLPNLLLHFSFLLLLQKNIFRKDFLAVIIATTKTAAAATTASLRR